MRILHLAYEDPAQPGSGGGSVRTREINRRLAGRHQITALVAGYPGAQPRVEDGITWVPIGTRRGGKLDRLSYFAALPLAVRHYPHDVLVEDFGAPFGPAFSPWLTGKPVVAMVQWMFAREMRAKYHLPFDWVERSGLRLYRDFIAVSDWLAAQIRRRRPDALIETIPNGVEEAPFALAAQPPRHLLYVGRLDRAQKGCDLLLESMAQAYASLGDALPPLLIVGDGPDQAELVAQAARLGLGGRVSWCGRITGVEKYRLMSQAFAVLMPSRWETFGMVALEAQAAGAPVITFEVGPLAEVAGPGGAVLIPPFDTAAFALAIGAAVAHADQWAARRQEGRRWAATYSWARLAERQERHYLAAVERSSCRTSPPSLEGANP